MRDNYEELLKKGFVVLGVSPDSEKSHKGFAEKYTSALPAYIRSLKRRS
ncbi:MAG: redoxin domain-containing protein [Marinilabiliales bacterium]|nr:redoxin domain-containing protein [Marinilabiliales bacterium]